MTEEQERTIRDISLLEEKLRALISENAQVAQDQEEYGRQYAALYGDYEQKLSQLEKIETEITNREAREERIRIFTDRLSKLDEGQTVFEEQLWSGIVEYVTVFRKDKIVFTFAGGNEITVGL